MNLTQLIPFILTAQAIILLTAAEIALITWTVPHLLTRQNLTRFFQPIRKATKK